MLSAGSLLEFSHNWIYGQLVDSILLFKCRNVIDTNNGCEKNYDVKIPEMIRKIYVFPISANKPTDLTDVKPATNLNQPNLNEKYVTWFLLNECS